MDAVVWSDYLCPWCYLGQARTAQLEALGVSVTVLPYELHPDIPVEGWTFEGRRGLGLYERLSAQCADAGLPSLARPFRLPNTRAVLAAAEWVRRHAPDAHATLHASLFHALFVAGEDLADPTVIDDLVAAAGADAQACRRAVDDGELDAALAQSRELADEAGVAGTPAWLIEGRLLIPGLQAPEYFDRMVARLRG